MHKQVVLSDNENVTAGSRLIRWGAHYKVGSRKIDQQHEQLIHLLNDLHSQWLDGASQPALSAVLRTLADAVRTHFRTEEELMAASRYHRFASHKAEHDAFAADLAAFQRAFHTSNASLDEALFDHLATWLRNHLLVSDKPMGAALRRTR